MRHDRPIQVADLVEYDSTPREEARKRQRIEAKERPPINWGPTNELGAQHGVSAWRGLPRMTITMTMAGETMTMMTDRSLPLVGYRTTVR